MARRGQVAAITTGVLHDTSVNFDTLPRKRCTMVYTASEVVVGYPDDQARGEEDMGPKVLAALPAERRHLIALGRDFAGYDYTKFQESGGAEAPAVGRSAGAARL